jgi:hypothetical protein
MASFAVKVAYLAETKCFIIVASFAAGLVGMTLI